METELPQSNLTTQAAHKTTRTSVRRRKWRELLCWFRFLYSSRSSRAASRTSSGNWRETWSAVRSASSTTPKTAGCASSCTGARSAGGSAWADETCTVIPVAAWLSVECVFLCGSHHRVAGCRERLRWLGWVLRHRRRRCGGGQKTAAAVRRRSAFLVGCTGLQMLRAVII